MTLNALDGTKKGLFIKQGIKRRNLRKPKYLDKSIEEMEEK